MDARKVLGIALAVLLLTVAGAGANELRCDKVIDNQVVSATSVYATSSVLKLQGHQYFSYTSKCTSAGGTAEFDLEFYTAPFNDFNMKAQVGSDLESGNTGEAWEVMAPISPSVAAFGWFIAKGSGSNATDSLCTVVFCKD